MKIAIIGAGISGIVCGRELSKNHNIVIFEEGSYVGGHTNTISVDHRGEHQEIDTGFIVYNNRTYPEFSRLLDECNVKTQSTKMTFGVRNDIVDLEYGTENLRSLMAQSSNIARPGYWRMLRDVKRFMSERETILASNPSVTVGDYCRANRYSVEFLEWYLLPIGSALWSSPLDNFINYPILFVAQFLSNHGMMQMQDRPEWRVIHGGSRQYIEPLTRTFSQNIRLNSPVRQVIRKEGGVEVSTDFGIEQFDHVVFACHADQALRILADKNSTENEVIGAFPFQKNEVILHTDTSVLPKRRKAWSSWNYHVKQGAHSSATLTYNMNILQGIKSNYTYCVSLNESDTIDPNEVIGKYVYHHPVSTVKSLGMQTKYGKGLETDSVSFCGAYWGFGFHEDGVKSALSVCKRFVEVQN